MEKSIPEKIFAPPGGLLCLFSGNRHCHTDKNCCKHKLNTDPLKNFRSYISGRRSVLCDQIIDSFIPVHRKKLGSFPNPAVQMIHIHKHTAKETHAQRNYIYNPAQRL